MDETIEEKMDDTHFNLFSFSSNPLLFEFRNIQSRISIFKERAKRFYYDVILSTVRCQFVGDV